MAGGDGAVLVPPLLRDEDEDEDEVAGLAAASALPNVTEMLVRSVSVPAVFAKIPAWKTKYSPTNAVLFNVSTSFPWLRPQCAGGWSNIRIAFSRCSMKIAIPVGIVAVSDGTAVSSIFVKP